MVYGSNAVRNGMFKTTFRRVISAHFIDEDHPWCLQPRPRAVLPTTEAINQLMFAGDANTEANSEPNLENAFDLG